MGVDRIRRAWCLRTTSALRCYRKRIRIPVYVEEEQLKFPLNSEPCPSFFPLPGKPESLSKILLPVYKVVEQYRLVLPTVQRRQLT